MMPSWMSLFVGGVLFAAPIKAIPYEPQSHDVRTQISSLWSDIGTLHDSLEKDMKTEDMGKIVKELSNILVLVLSELESTTSFQANVSADLADLSAELNETRCTLSTRLIDVENQISHPKTSPQEADLEDTNNVNRRPRLVESNFVVTPSLEYTAARRHCFSSGGKPFVPTTMDEFRFTVKQLTKLHEFGWIPLNDILTEGHGEWDDGTEYDHGSVKLRFTDTDWVNGNTDHQDCVDVNASGDGDWFICNKRRPMLCLKRTFTYKTNS